MEITIHYNESSDDKVHTSLKMTLPKKWKEGEVKQVKEYFMKALMKKHPLLNITSFEDYHFEGMDGSKFSDKDVVGWILDHGSDVFLKSGSAPTERTVTSEPKAIPKTVTKTVEEAPKKQMEQDDDDDDNGTGFVSSKDALEKAKQKKLDFDYSQWDRLDLSDDDEADCHPNIDKASWKRLKGQMRQDRRKEEEEKISKLKGKITKHSQRAMDLEKRMNEAETEEEKQKLKGELRDAKKSAKSYQEKLDHFLAHRKLVADDLCETKEDFSRVETIKETPPIPGLGPEKPENEESAYDIFVRKYKNTLLEYSKIRHDDDSEEFIRMHPEILDTHAEGYFLLLCLHKAMTHLKESGSGGDVSKEKKAKHLADEMQVARQHLFIQYILELSKSMKVDPRAAVRPFFQKTSKNSPQQVKGFEDDLKAFVERIRKRAADKIANNEPSPLAEDGSIRSSSSNTDDSAAEIDEENLELAPLGPGGLDPTEVLQSLPKDLQDAFISQDTDALKAALGRLSDEEASYHFQRCIDSGLWVQPS